MRAHHFTYCYSTCLHSGPYLLSLEDRFDLWYRPIYEARRSIFPSTQHRILSFGRGCRVPNRSGTHCAIYVLTHLFPLWHYCCDGGVNKVSSMSWGSSTVHRTEMYFMPVDLVGIGHHLLLEPTCMAALRVPIDLHCNINIKMEL